MAARWLFTSSYCRIVAIIMGVMNMLPSQRHLLVAQHSTSVKHYVEMFYVGVA